MCWSPCKDNENNSRQNDLIQTPLPRLSDKGDRISCFAQDSLSYACHPSMIFMMSSLILKSILLWTMKIYGHPVLDPVVLQIDRYFSTYQ